MNVNELYVSHPDCAWEDRYDYICYVPTPRCASTSIKDCLKREGILSTSYLHDVPGPNGIFVSNPVMTWSDTVQWRWWQHFLAHPEDSQISRKINSHELKLLLWTVLRNPYDRIVSAWQVALREKWVYDDMPLEEFIGLMITMQRGHVKTMEISGEWRPVLTAGDSPVVVGDLHRTGVENAFAHSASITASPIFTTDFNTYLKEDPDRFSEGVSGVSNLNINGIHHGITPTIPARYRHPMLFRYLKFESLQSDFNVLCDRIGWNRTELPHHNEIKRDDFMSYHTEKTIYLTNILYDFEFFCCYSDERINC